MNHPRRRRTPRKSRPLDERWFPQNESPTKYKTVNAIQQYQRPSADRNESRISSISCLSCILEELPKHQLSTHPNEEILLPQQRRRTRMARPTSTTRTSANADEHVYRTHCLEGSRHIHQTPPRRPERAPERFGMCLKSDPDSLPPILESHLDRRCVWRGSLHVKSLKTLRCSLE